MLNVAGWPLAMGSGDISTPLTSTPYSPFLSDTEKLSNSLFNNGQNSKKNNTMQQNIIEL